MVLHSGLGSENLAKTNIDKPAGESGVRNPSDPEFLTGSVLKSPQAISPDEAGPVPSGSKTYLVTLVVKLFSKVALSIALRG